MSLELEFRKSFVHFFKKNVKDIILDTAEASIDTIITNDILKNIPFIEWGIKAKNTIDEIRINYLIKKLIKFFTNTLDIESIDYQNFVRDITQREADEISNLILITIDRINSEDKAEMIGNLFSALVRKKIRKEVFLRLVNVIETVYIDDLKTFLKYRGSFYQNRNILNLDINQIFVTLGLYNSHIVKKKDNIQRVHLDAGLEFDYTLSNLGELFINVCRMSKN